MILYKQSKSHFWDLQFSKVIAWRVDRAFAKFKRLKIKSQGVLICLVRPILGNMDLKAPGSFERDPPSTASTSTSLHKNGEHVVRDLQRHWSQSTISPHHTHNTTPHTHTNSCQRRWERQIEGLRYFETADIQPVNVSNSDLTVTTASINYIFKPPI